MSAFPGVRRAQRLGRAVTTVLRRRSPRGLVLLYHRVAGPRRDPQALDVSCERFEEQIALLRRLVTPLPLDEFEARRRSGTLPARALAVTFDDGYADNLLAAAPILAAHGVPATVFVTAGMVGANREFWWDDAERIAFAPKPLGESVPLLAVPWSAADGSSCAPGVDHDRWTVLDRSDPTPRHRLYRAMCAALHAAPPATQVAMLTAWREWAGVPEAARASHRTVSADELRALAAVPGISIGAHTMTHPALARLPLETQRGELEESRMRLEHDVGRPVTSVAYPFGTRTDVSAATTRAASAAGFDYALANEPAPAWRWSSRWRVPRVIVRDLGADVFAQLLDAWFAA